MGAWPAGSTETAVALEAQLTSIQGGVAADSTFRFDRMGDWCEISFGLGPRGGVAGAQRHHSGSIPVNMATGTPPPADGDFLFVVKSHAMGHKDAILNMVRSAGFTVLSENTDVPMARYKALYREHEGREYYDGLIQTVVGPTSALWLRDATRTPTEASEALNALVGPTVPSDARASAPGSIRGLYSGEDLPFTAVHRSDTVESGRLETTSFFGHLSIPLDG